MRDLLGRLGIIEPERPEIEYRERAPLVVPPDLELRPPVNPGSVQARNPQWPNDPDVAAQQRAAAAARVPVTQQDLRRPSENNPRLSIDEIRAGRRPGAGIPTGPVYRHGDNSRDEFWVRPEVLRAQDRNRDDSRPSAVEPGRQALTDPPAGFRRPAAGAPVRDVPEPVNRVDEADPGAYIRQQRATR